MNTSRRDDSVEGQVTDVKLRRRAWQSVPRIAILLAAIALLAWAIFDPQFLLLKASPALFLLCVLFVMVSRSAIFKNVFLSAATLFLVIAISDAAVRLLGRPAKTTHTERTYARGYSRLDPVLGKRPSGPGEFKATLRGPDGTEIYNVTYTIDEDGFRHVPGNDGEPPTYLFFGGSLTYGEGVEDGQTYPAVFKSALGRSGTVVDVAFHGYGPHQMLRAIEVGLFDREIKGSVARAFYLMIPTHMNRAIGLYSWTYQTPRYVLDPNGDVRSVGLYSDWWVRRWLRFARSEGGLLKLVAERFYDLIFPLRKRQELTAAIISKSARLLKEKYGTTLTCLVWDGGDWYDGDYDGLVEALARQDIELVPVSRFLGNLGDPSYTFPYDGHPTALAHRKLGEALAQRVLGNSTE